MADKPESFYVTGGTLRSDSASYVEREADKEIFEGLSRSEFCYVLTSRQMGKSSLMVRTAAKLREAGASVVVLDLTAIGQNLSPEQWYDGLIVTMGRQLRLEDALDEYWLNNSRMSPVLRWFTSLSEVVLPKRTGNVVFFVDEIDAVRSLPFSTDEFFAAIKECYNHRSEDPEFNRLTFCLLGVATPRELISNAATTPFNIGRRIDLSDFTAEEAAPLVKGLNRDNPIGAAMLKRILYWTHGHPYLTQKLCRAVALDTSRSGPASIDRLCEQLFLSAQAREQDDNLLFVRERILRSKVDLFELLELYRRVRAQRGNLKFDEANPLIAVLRLSGIVRVEDGVLKVRNRIYFRVFDEDWIQSSLPAPELERQQLAFRKGYRRALRIAAALVAVVFLLAAFHWNSATSHQDQVASMSARAAQAEAALERTRLALYVADMQSAQKAFQENNLTLVTNLLRQHGPRQGELDWRGFEWRHLWSKTKPSASFISEDAAVSGLAVSPDGAWLAVTTPSRVTLRRWPKLEFSSALPVMAKQVVFSPAGKILATVDELVLRIWDVATWKEQRRFPQATGPIAFSPDGQWLVSGSPDRLLRLWNTRDWSVKTNQLAVDARPLEFLFSPDSVRLLVVGTGAKSFKLPELTEEKLAQLEKLDHAFTCARFTLDGNLLAGTKSGDVVLFPMPGGTGQATAARRLYQHQSVPSAMALSADGQLLATAGWDCLIHLYDLKQGVLVDTLQGHNSRVTALAFSSRDRVLLSASNEGLIGKWDAAAAPKELALTTRGPAPDFMVNAHEQLAALTSAGVELKPLPTGSAQTIAFQKWPGPERIARQAFTKKGTELVVALTNGLLQSWELASREMKKETAARPAPPRILSYAAGSSRLAAVYASEVLLFPDDLSSDPEALVLQAESTAAAFSEDGNQMAVLSDTSGRIWNLPSRKTVPLQGAQPPVIQAAAFSPNSQTLATGGSDGTLALWSAVNGRQLSLLPGRGNPIEALACSPDGFSLAIGHADGKIVLMNLGTLREVYSFPKQNGAIEKLFFAKDGKRFIAGGRDFSGLFSSIAVFSAPSLEEIDSADPAFRKGRAAQATARKRVGKWFSIIE